MRGREVGARGQENSDGGTVGSRGLSRTSLKVAEGGRECQNEHKISCRPIARHRKRGDRRQGRGGRRRQRGTHLCGLLLLLLRLLTLLLATEPTANEERAVEVCKGEGIQPGYGRVVMVTG